MVNRMSHYPPITPHLAIDDVAAALEFYPRAFGADRAAPAVPAGRVDRARRAGPERRAGHPRRGDPGSTAWSRRTRTVRSRSRSRCPWTTSTPRTERAIEAGATGMSEPADQFHGDRTAALRCPFGHKWILQKHLRDVSPDEAQRLLTEMMSGAYVCPCGRVARGGAQGRRGRPPVPAGPPPTRAGPGRRRRPLLVGRVVAARGHPPRPGRDLAPVRPPHRRGGRRLAAGRGHPPVRGPAGRRRPRGQRPPAAGGAERAHRTPTGPADRPAGCRWPR